MKPQEEEKIDRHAIDVVCTEQKIAVMKTQ